MHDHNHGTSTKEEAIALLKYMAGHNEHHTEELHDLSHHFEGEVHELLHDAVHAYEDANKKLQEALKLITGE